MKVLLLTALLLLLCSTLVPALRCYTCENENDLICKTPTECDPSAIYCKTSTKGGLFSRTCEALCGMDLFTNCCQEDLC